MNETRGFDIRPPSIRRLVHDLELTRLRLVELKILPIQSHRIKHVEIVGEHVDRQHVSVQQLLGIFLLSWRQLTEPTGESEWLRIERSQSAALDRKNLSRHSGVGARRQFRVHDFESLMLAPLEDRGIDRVPFELMHKADEK